MNGRIDAEVRAVRAGYGSYGIGRGGPLAIGDSAGAANPPVASVPNSSGTDAEVTAPAHSETETQVKGVDEADIVKADGTRLYVLHGQSFLIVDAWPAPNL